jgi:hypothetical protein
MAVQLHNQLQANQHLPAEQRLQLLIALLNAGGYADLASLLQQQVTRHQQRQVMQQQQAHSGGSGGLSPVAGAAAAAGGSSPMFDSAVVQQQQQVQAMSGLTGGCCGSFINDWLHVQMSASSAVAAWCESSLRTCVLQKLAFLWLCKIVTKYTLRRLPCVLQARQYRHSCSSHLLFCPASSSCTQLQAHLNRRAAEAAARQHLTRQQLQQQRQRQQGA